MNVYDAVTSRRSIRQFTDQPVSLETLRRVITAAQMAPSGCNFQPWQATILAGEPLRALQEKMTASPIQDPAEYSWMAPEVLPDHKERLQQMGASLYGAMGIGRSDTDMRAAFSSANIHSFGAPAVLLCHFPRVMGPPQWSDVGMWLQTVMLLLREEGLDSCPQEFLAMYARIIKEHIGVSDEDHIFFCGIAIGYRDDTVPVNQFERARVPIDEVVKFQGF